MGCEELVRTPLIKTENNDAELSVRAHARKGDVSFQTKNDKGTQAKDTFMTIIQTARKLGVNIIDYTRDRLTKAFKMPSLPSLIIERSQLNADTS